MRKDIFRKSFIVVLLLLIFAVGLVSDNSHANSVELSTAVDELECGGGKVIAETTCTADSKRPLIFMTCISQTFSFKNTKDKVVKKVSNKNIVAEKDSKHLYAISTDWACIDGKNGAYLFLEFNTGGNCAECEWYEIYRMNGQKVASAKNKTDEGIDKFNKLYKSLGFPEKWPRSSFSRIKILKNQR